MRRIRRFRISSLNIQAHLSLRQVAADVRRAMRAKVDAIGFQEIGGDRKAAVMRAVLRLFGMRLVRLDGPASAVPIAYNARRWRKVDAFTWDVSERTHVGARGAGPRTLREKDATVVHLEKRRRRRRRQLPKREAFIINAHLAPSLRYQVRSELHETQIESLAELVTQIRREHPDAEIHMVGDFNTGDHRRLQPLIDAGLHLAPDVATKGKHPIDRGLSTFPNAHARAVDGFNTDHRQLVVGLVSERTAA